MAYSTIPIFRLYYSTDAEVCYLVTAMDCLGFEPWPSTETHIPFNTLTGETSLDIMAWPAEWEPQSGSTGKGTDYWGYSKPL